jgi:two-component system sensor histidine kinase RegB
VASAKIDDIVTAQQSLLGSDHATGNSSVDARPVDSSPSYSDTANRKNLALLIQLRWIAVVGQIVTILLVSFGLGIQLPLGAMALVLAALVTLNLISLVWLQQHIRVSTRALFIALLLDVAALSAQLYLSGGTSNPFIALYLLQIALAAVLLNAKASWTIVAATSLGFILLTWFNQPLALPPHHQELQILGTFVCFALNAALVVVFVTRMNRNLRERDAHLAELKQQAAEETHIVRMGLLASGAAHELGTPLASVAIILGDWQQMPQITRDPAMLEELEEMQAAVQRCKTILSGVLQSAGEARGEAPAVTALRQFIEEIVRDWSAQRPGDILHHQLRPSVNPDIAIIADPALKQVVTNLLENAYEVSPNWIELNVDRSGDLLRIEVLDAGPGFTQEMLANVGKPYHSTKTRQGAGLGLFLVVNVVRKLGGTVTASNRESGGAMVTIELPLAALTLPLDHA